MSKTQDDLTVRVESESLGLKKKLFLDYIYNFNSENCRAQFHTRNGVASIGSEFSFSKQNKKLRFGSEPAGPKSVDMQQHQLHPSMHHRIHERDGY